MAWYDVHIEKTYDICGGEPVIKNTRISVLAIVEYTEVYSSAKIALPYLTDNDIGAALAYYQDHKEEIEEYRRLDIECDTLDIPDRF